MRISLAIILFFLNSYTVYSGPGKGHYHTDLRKKDIKNEQSIEIAKGHIFRLVMKGILNKSWNNYRLVSSEKKVFNGNKEWAVIFKNDKEVEKKKTLYIFLSTKGDFIAANFSGK